MSKKKARALWSVPELWPGGTVVCVGGGPSLTPKQVDYCLGRARVVVVNDGYLLAPWADALYFADGPRKWYGWHKDRPEFQAFTGQRVTIDHPFAADDDPRNRILRNDGVPGLCERADGLRIGHNGGHQAINLACHLIGWRGRVLLIGYDMKRAKNGRENWHDNHRQAKDNRFFQANQIRLFDTMRPVLDRLGVRVLNCTPGSAIECFPRMGLKEALG